MSPIVSIIMGSTSDLPVMEKAAQLLNDMHVPFEINALSAHRTPEAVEQFAKGAQARGIKVIIAAAGMAAVYPLERPELASEIPAGCCKIFSRCRYLCNRQRIYR